MRASTSVEESPVGFLVVPSAITINWDNVFTTDVTDSDYKHNLLSFVWHAFTVNYINGKKNYNHNFFDKSRNI